MSVAGQNTVSSEALRSFVERIENVNDERERLADDAKVIFAEAKSQGFIPAADAAVSTMPWPLSKDATQPSPAENMDRVVPFSGRA